MSTSNYFFAWILAAAPATAFAQVIINAPPTVVGDDFFLYDGETLNVFTGGEVGHNFRANDGSIVRITGGSVGDFFYAYSGSEIDISGGSVGFRFEAFGSKVNITGGTVGDVFMAHSGSAVNISGGSVKGVRAESGSEIQISGGTVGAALTLYNSIIAYPGAAVSITGGTVGSAFNAQAGSDVRLVGGEFRLNGAEYTGASITFGNKDIFTGTLTDGSSFIFSPLTGDNLQAVVLIPASLPPPNLTPMVINSPVIDGPSGLRSGQTLTVQVGGELRDNFAVVDAALNIDGGKVGGGVEVIGGTVNISAGIVGPELDATMSTVNMSGGTLGERSTAYLGSVVNISGGTVGSKFYAAPGSEVNISGGVVAFDFWARAGSDVELIGGEFQLNGATFTGSTITLDDNDVFTGTLEDGSTFVFSRMANPLGDELYSVKLTRTTLPTLNLKPIVVNSPIADAPSGLRAGQMLTVQSGGELQDHFAAVGAVLNIEGGAVGEGLEVSQSTVTISGGTVGNLFQAYDSDVNISGGEVGNFSAHPGTSLNINGGAIDSVWSFAPTKSVVVNISGDAVIGYLDAYRGSVVNMSGGTVDGDFGIGSAAATISGGTVRGGVNVNNNSTVNILGGTIGGNFTTTSSPGTEVNISGGTVEGFFTIRSEVEFNLFGRQFSLDGIPLDALQIGSAFTITDRNVSLSGLLADGTHFSFYLDSHTISEGYFSHDATITVTLVVPEPLSLGQVLLAVAALIASAKPRRP